VCIFSSAAFQEEGCNHHVTLILFSRTFYKAKSESECPPEMAPTLCQDYRGVFYSDYYEVILDGTKWMEWTYVVSEVKRNFKTYKQKTNCDTGASRPNGYISQAAHGNFLECLNLTVNLFSKKHLNPNFHLTGQQVVIVTAGVGVFEVQREMTRITSERLMDYGLGVDVVSLTEQPLHAVPLFSLQSPDPRLQSDYIIPQWINYSFYDPQSEWTGGWFQPRIRLPDYMINSFLKDFSHMKDKRDVVIPTVQKSSRCTTPMLFLKRDCDFDDYDSEVFRKSSNKVVMKAHSSVHTDSPVLRRHHSNEYLYGSSFMPSPKIEHRKVDRDCEDHGGQSVRRIPNRPRRHLYSESSDSPNLSGPIVQDSVGRHEHVSHSPSLTQYLAQRQGADAIVKRPLINPFRPRSLPQEVSANKRKWMHAFPFTTKGHAFQSHHAMGEDLAEALLFSVQQQGKSEMGGRREESAVRKRSESDSDLVQMDGLDCDVFSPQETQSLDGVDIEDMEEPSSESAVPPPPGARLRKKGNKKQSNITKRPLFESTTSDKKGVKPDILDNFAPVRRTGIDWKALTDPACLPVTTDYLPSEKTLADDFSTNLYLLSASQLQSESGSAFVNLNCVSGFRELISQRLSQGFQIVLPSSVTLSSLHEKLEKIASDIRTKRHSKEGNVLVKMSLGRVYHYLTLTYPTISIAVHKAKHTPKFGKIPYRYHLRPPNHPSFLPCECVFHHEKAEEYNWNYLDQHVMGYEDFDILSEGIKYHRSRFLLLPSSNLLLHPQESKKQVEEAVVAGFVRFFEFLNYLRRPSTRKSSHDSLTSLAYSNRDSSVFSSRLVSKTSRHGSLASLAEEGHHLTFNRYSSWDVPVRSSADLGGRGPHTRTPSPTFARTSTTSSHSSVGDSARTSTSSVAGKENKLVPVLRRSTSTDVMSQGLLKAVHLGDSAGRTSGLHVALSSNLRRQNSDLLDSVVAKGDVTPNPELLSRPSLSPDSSRPQSRSDRSSSEASFYLEGSVHVEDYPLNEGTTGSTVEGETVSALTKSDVTVKETPPTPKGSTSPSSQEEDADEQEESRICRANDLPGIVKAMKDDKFGLDFVVSTKSNSLRNNSFVAKELVDWMKDNVEGVHTTFDGLKLCRKMQRKGLVIHASGSPRVPFQYGFYLFSLTNVDLSEEATNLPSPKLNTSFVIISGELEAFRRHRFEAGIVMDGGEEWDDDVSVKSTPHSESPAPASFKLPLQDQDEFLEQAREELSDIEWTINHTVQICPDVNGISDRTEWCTVNYDSVFIPSIAYQIEFQWVVTTATLLAKQITQWSRKAEMSGFHLVSVPSWQNLEQNPFHKPHSIPLPLNLDKMNAVGIATDPKTIFKCVHQILQKFGFVLDPISIQDDMDALCHDAVRKKSRGSLEEWVRSGDISWQCCPVYVHHTGVCLVKPILHKIRSTSVRQSTRFSSSSGYFYRTDSEATLNACSPDMDNVFHFKHDSQWSLKHGQHPVYHSTPHHSPDHFTTYQYSFHWYVNTNILHGGVQRLIPSKTDPDLLFKDFQNYCENVNDHLVDLSTAAKLFDTGSNQAGIASTY
jgi:hypothetical protein